MLTADSHPALRGGLLALLAAVLFGVSTPLVQRFGTERVRSARRHSCTPVPPPSAGLLSRRRVEREARLVRADLRRLVAMTVSGALVGPVALAWGLQRTSGTSASLMLTLEALFTAGLAWRLCRETMDRRVWTAMLLLLAGGVVLVVDQGRSGGAQLLGLLAVLLATVAWGVDNTLSRALAERDPGQVVLAKALLGASATALLAVALDEPGPPLLAALALFVVGATGYGISLRFYLLAQRAFGPARTGSVFAFAPFIGAVGAIALGDRALSWLMAGGSLLMLAGVILHLSEIHAHEHTHESTEHEHAHRHSDVHHNHRHDPMPEGEHSHRHAHEPLRHSHAHVPDVHHQHIH
jgi:drug/metabolite transporter (DMT)-like permease